VIDLAQVLGHRSDLEERVWNPRNGPTGRPADSTEDAGDRTDIIRGATSEDTFAGRIPNRDAPTPKDPQGEVGDPGTAACGPETRPQCGFPADAGRKVLESGALSDHDPFAGPSAAPRRANKAGRSCAFSVGSDSHSRSACRLQQRTARGWTTKVTHSRPGGCHQRTGDELQIPFIVNSASEELGLDPAAGEITGWVSGLVSTGTQDAGDGVLSSPTAQGGSDIYRDPSSDHDFGTLPRMPQCRGASRTASSASQER